MKRNNDVHVAPRAKWHTGSTVKLVDEMQVELPNALQTWPEMDQ